MDIDIEKIRKAAKAYVEWEDDNEFADIPDAKQIIAEIEEKERLGRRLPLHSQLVADRDERIKGFLDRLVNYAETKTKRASDLKKSMLSAKSKHLTLKQWEDRFYHNQMTYKLSSQTKANAKKAQREKNFIAWFNDNVTFFPHLTKRTVKIDKVTKKPVSRSSQEEKEWVEGFTLRQAQFILKREGNLDKKRLRRDMAEVSYPFRPQVRHDFVPSKLTARSDAGANARTTVDKAQKRTAGMPMQRECGVQMSGFKLVSTREKKDHKALTTVQLNEEFNDVWYYVARYLPPR